MKRILPILLAGIALNHAPSSAQGAFSSDMMAPSPRSQQSGTCLPRNTAQDAEIVALAVEQPDAFPLMLRMGERQQDAANLVTVTGGAGKDVVLLLGSSGSVVWDLRAVPQDRIKGVIISTPNSSSQSGVAGLADDIPLEFTNSSNPRSSGYDIDCLGIPVAAKLELLPVITKAVTARFGRIPDRMYVDSDAQGFDLDGGLLEDVEKQQAPEASQIRSSMSVIPLETLPGEAGMKQLVERGVLKPFGPADVQKWREAGATFTNLLSVEERIQAQIGSNTNPEIRARMQTMIENQDRNITPRAGYVATSSFTLPDGYRPNPQDTVIAPEGVNVDTGDARLGPMSYILRVSGISADQLVTTGNPIAEQIRQHTQGRNQPMAFEAQWSADGIMLNFPEDDFLAIEEAEEEKDAWPWLLAGLFGLLAAGLGVALFLVTRGRKRTAT